MPVKHDSRFFSISFCCGFQVCIPSLIAPYLASSSRVGNTNVLLLLMKKGPQFNGSTDCHGLPWIQVMLEGFPRKTNITIDSGSQGKKTQLPSSERSQHSHLWKRKNHLKCILQTDNCSFPRMVQYHCFQKSSMNLVDIQNRATFASISLQAILFKKSL